MQTITLFKTIKEARLITSGDVSNKNSKMLGSTFGLSPFMCKKGMELAKIEGSVCNQCYAKRGTGVYKNVKQGRANNTNAVIEATKTKQGINNWVSAMVYLIEKRDNTGFFRWHDAGDLQNMAHLKMVVSIANLLPHIKFWLPTKEIKLLRQYNDVIPENLCIRVSAPMVDQKPVKTAYNTSTVHKMATGYGFVCPAPKQGNKCGDCTACYNTNIANVSYHKH